MMTRVHEFGVVNTCVVPFLEKFEGSRDRLLLYMAISE